MTLSIQFKTTDAGQAANFNATRTGVSLNITHIQLGSGNKASDGTERKLVSPKQAASIASGGQVAKNQIRMSAIFSGDVAFDIAEVGIWSGDPSLSTSFLVAYWSQATGKLDVKSPGVDFVFTYDWTFAYDIPLGQIKVIADPTQSYMLDVMYRHEQAINPHPQYTTDEEVIALIEARVGDYVIAGGTANALTAVLVPAVTAYTAQTTFTFKSLTANTGAVTMNAGGGAKAIVRNDGTPLQAGDIQAGNAYTVVYDTNSTAFVMTEVVTSQVERQIATALQLQTKTAFTTTGWVPAYVATPNPALTTLLAGHRFSLTIHASASGAPTLNVNGTGVKNVKQYNSSGGKIAAVLKAGQVADVVYDGVDWMVMNPLTPTIAAEVLTGMTFMWPKSIPPDGFLLENGAFYNPAVYVNLFNVIGYAFGKDSRGWFAVDDKRDRMPVGAGWRWGAGAKGGNANAVVVSHSHSTSQSQHQHATSWGETWGGNYGNARNGARGYQGSGRSDGDNYEYLTSPEYISISVNPAGQSGVDANLPPFSATYFIIKY